MPPSLLCHFLSVPKGGIISKFDCNAITAPKLSLHNLKCWQINLHRCKTASYNMCEVTKSVRSGLVLAQQPWTYATKIKSKLRGWNLFQGIENGNRPQACIYVTPDLCCSLIPMFSNEDIVAIRVNNVCQKGHSLFSYQHTWQPKNQLRPIY